MRADDPFYGEFKIAQISQPITLTTTKERSEAGSGVRTLAQLTILVESAVLSVVGAAIGLHQPLIEAGLDSLGRLHHPISCFAKPSSEVPIK